MKHCDNCFGKVMNDGVLTIEGLFCSKDCSDGFFQPVNEPVNEPVEYEVKFIAEEPVPTYPMPESFTSRIKKHCTRCAAIINAEPWKSAIGVFCSKDCAMGGSKSPHDTIIFPPHVEVTKTAPEPKDEVTLFDYYAAKAMAALIVADSRQSVTYIVDTAASFALIALEERKKYIND